jgi:hypothetical protein
VRGEVEPTDALDILTALMNEAGGPPPEYDDHAARVREAFDAFHEKVGSKLDGEARESMEKLRQAAAEKDAGRFREHMGQVQERHGWLYRELAEHPAIATLLDELALWGF